MIRNKFREASQLFYELREIRYTKKKKKKIILNNLFPML